jgi:hypothetical protein
MGDRRLPVGLSPESRSPQLKNRLLLPMLVLVQRLGLDVEKHPPAQAEGVVCS